MSATGRVEVKPCAPWCTYGPHDAEHPVDRRCADKVASTGLHLHDPALMVSNPRDAEAYWYDQLDVWLRRLPGQTEAEVLLHHQEDDTEIRMTLAEAWIVAQAITRAVTVLAPMEPGERL